MGLWQTMLGRLLAAGGDAPDAVRATDGASSSAQLLDAVIASLPDAAIVLDRDGAGRRVQRARARHRAGACARRARLAGAARPGSGRGGARGRGRRRRAQRRVRPARAGRPLVHGACPPARRRAAGRLDPAGVPRPHAAAPRRGDARRLRRQCEPRTAHAARGAVRLHRHAAGHRARRRAGARALPRHHEDAGRRAWRG